MAAKKCPKCGRYSVSANPQNSIEFCHWTDCNWVNVDGILLPEAHRTIITSGKRETRRTIITSGKKAC